MMLMMNLSNHHSTHPTNYLLYIAVLGDNKGLIDKATFNLPCSDHCVEWAENRIKVYQINRVSKFIASEGTAGWQRTAQSRFGLICIATQGLLGKNLWLWGELM